jgi:hypothetical protein
MLFREQRKIGQKGLGLRDPWRASHIRLVASLGPSGNLLASFAKTS